MNGSLDKTTTKLRAYGDYSEDENGDPIANEINVHLNNLNKLAAKDKDFDENDPNNPNYREKVNEYDIT